MKILSLVLAAFAGGLSIGWLGNSWLQSRQLTSVTSIGVENEDPTSQRPTANNRQPSASEGDSSNNGFVNNEQGINAQPLLSESQFFPTGASITNTFNRLLSDRLYQDAINLYQEQKNQNTDIAVHLRITLIEHLKLLTETQRNSDFSTLIDHYLSAYYDDLDILLLLADFNRANGSYLEVVDVYLLATTYAYADIDQQRVLNHFNGFVDGIDRLYTAQSNWWSLINFYSHINTSGLMTSTLQYQQALAYLRSGDEGFAIEQFNQLLNDSVIGASAAIALNNLDNHTTASAVDNNPVQENSESIDLQKIGNQYAVNLTNNRQDTVKLLIDTGASMTTVSSASFNTLGIGIDAVEQDRRVFRTAGGVVMGSVYSVPALRLGPYLLENTLVAVIDFETNQAIDGLLGMNILGQFRFQIDQENTQLHLIKK